jgi:hypothetical protein
MNRTLARALSASLVVIAITACKDDPKHSITAPDKPKEPAPVVGSVAWLTVSDSTPAEGSIVTVTGRATSSDVAAFGSFAGHVTFDALGLEYVSDVTTSAGMRALNPKPGDLAIAGVNLTGFEEGELFAITLKVVKPSAVRTLALSMSELTGTNYVNQRASLSIEPSLRLGRAVTIVQ